MNTRNSIFEYAKTMNDDVVLLESYFDDFEESTHPLKYLARSISVMADADLVYFCNGWKDTRGCRIEHLCAKHYNKEIRYI